MSTGVGGRAPPDRRTDVAEHPAGVLTRLSDTGRTVADPAQDVRGRTVRDADGSDLGTVDDLIVDRADEQVRMLRVEHGGILGIGAEVVLVPVEAVVAITGEEVRIDQSRQRVAGSPPYDPELTDQSEYYEALYGYYGYAPFWAPGYAGRPWPAGPGPGPL
ncbi:PRC-barrel domain-containing protein [Kineococcus esterisolvens]|uniref:PRC-barrel domain-containing protein n=1 Tax=Kineococcus sp. SYSU DK031 TaxID=3383152 RepID=UPI003D7C5FB1